jgi:hypothetical protein
MGGQYYNGSLVNRAVVDWIYVVQDRKNWWAFVNMVMNLEAP